ncbi:DUF1348 family protein [Streptomyces sp. NPDC048473]|uniref:DUF1348 family protein n=1 Tax=unclassified Streptomyces TaxID=2593676 RepID=UPI003715E3C8
MTGKPPYPVQRRYCRAEGQAGEDAWNTRNPEAVSLACTEDSRWRNRSVFINGRKEIVDFLTHKWENELEYRLIKELWSFGGHRITVRFAYEYRTVNDDWFRAYGNENWELSDDGLMSVRHTSINERFPTSR